MSSSLSYDLDTLSYHHILKTHRKLQKCCCSQGVLPPFPHWLFLYQKWFWITRLLASACSSISSTLGHLGFAGFGFPWALALPSCTRDSLYNSRTGYRAWCSWSSEETCDTEGSRWTQFPCRSQIEGELFLPPSPAGWPTHQLLLQAMGYF
jgi:hypothetical protein